MTKDECLEQQRKAFCDLVLARAASMMVDEAGASVAMMIDRLLTFAAAQACTIDGSPATAEVFRRLADNIEAGCFHPITGEDKPLEARH